jgi:hypothetical protein
MLCPIWHKGPVTLLSEPTYASAAAGAYRPALGSIKAQPRHNFLAGSDRMSIRSTVAFSKAVDHDQLLVAGGLN